MTIIFKLEPRNLLTRSSDGKVIFTYSDIETLPGWPETPVVEIIEGDLFIAPSPTVVHQKISGDLAFLLKDHVRKNQLGEVLCAPVDVLFSERDVSVPDILFISKARNHILTKKNVQGAPDLIVEILSSNRDLDLVKKKAMYERHGVLEYWIVDPEEKSIHVYLLDNESKKFESPVVYTQEKSIPVSVIHSMTVQVEDIFKNI